MVYDGTIIDAGGQVFNVRSTAYAGGAAGNGTTNDIGAIQAALAAAQVKGGIVYFPPGTYRVAPPTSTTVPTLSVTAPGVYFQGAGASSTIEFHPSSAPTVPGPQPCILFDGVSSGGVSGLRIVHIGSKAVNRQPQTLLYADGGCIEVRNSTNCAITGNHLQWGEYGVFLSNTADPASLEVWTANLNHTVSENHLLEQARNGIDCWHASGCRILGNHVEGVGSEGFKFQKRNHAMNVSNNYVTESGRDGMDFYDGLTESAVTGNTACDNSNFGFELKGLFGGNFAGAVDDFVFRDTTFTGNNAIRNPAAGITVTSVRNVTLTGNNVVSAGPQSTVSSLGQLAPPAWTLAGSATHDADVESSPDATTRSDRLNGTDTAGNWAYYTVTPPTAGRYTFTAVLKGTGTTQLVIEDASGARTRTVTLASADYTRFSISANVSSGATFLRVGVGNHNAGTATSVMVTGLELVYTGWTVGYTGLNDSSSWTPVGAVVGTAGSSSNKAPDGSTSYYTLAPSSTPGWVHYSRDLAEDTPYTLTVWLRGSGTTQLVFYSENASVPAVQTTLVTLTSTWTRYSLTASALVGATNLRLGFGNYNAGTAITMDAWGMQILSMGHGILVTSSQGVALVGNNVSKCAGHGILWQVSSRGTMTGNNTIDNSYLDGVVQNAAYDGVSVDATSGVFVTGARSFNGTVANHKGGQGYGLTVGTGSKSIVWGGDFSGNVVGSIPTVGDNLVAGVRNKAAAFLGPYLSPDPASPVDGTPCYVLAPRVSYNDLALPTGATPSVAGGNHFVTQNAAATTITSFTNGAGGQPLVIEAGDNFTTIANSAYIATRTGSSITLSTGQIVLFHRNAANSKWVQI